MQFDFLAVLVVFLFKLFVILLVLQGSEPYLPMLPSWTEITLFESFFKTLGEFVSVSLCAILWAK